MVLGIEDGDLMVALDGEAAGLGKEGVADVVLRSTAGGAAEIAGPPLISVTAVSAALWTWGEDLVVGEKIGKLAAEVVHGVFKPVVEHIADHGHAAAHPLATAEFGATELSHRAAAVVHADKHANGGIIAEIVAAGDVADEIFALGSELMHGEEGMTGDGWEFAVWRKRVARDARGSNLFRCLFKSRNGSWTGDEQPVESASGGIS